MEILTRLNKHSKRNWHTEALEFNLLKFTSIQVYRQSTINLIQASLLWMHVHVGLRLSIDVCESRVNFLKSCTSCKAEIEEVHFRVYRLTVREGKKSETGREERVRGKREKRRKREEEKKKGGKRKKKKKERKRETERKNKKRERGREKERRKQF